MMDVSRELPVKTQSFFHEHGCGVYIPANREYIVFTIDNSQQTVTCSRQNEPPKNIKFWAGGYAQSIVEQTRLFCRRIQRSPDMPRDLVRDAYRLKHAIEEAIDTAGLDESALATSVLEPCMDDNV